MLGDAAADMQRRGSPSVLLLTNPLTLIGVLMSKQEKTIAFTPAEFLSVVRILVTLTQNAMRKAADRGVSMSLGPIEQSAAGELDEARVRELIDQSLRTING